jgi:hypothetical protein
MTSHSSASMVNCSSVPYAPFHLREVTNEMAALQVLDWFEGSVDLGGR